MYIVHIMPLVEKLLEFFFLVGVGNLQKVVCNVTKNKGGKGGGRGVWLLLEKGTSFLFVKLN